MKEFSPAIIESLKKDTTEMKQYLPKGWEKVVMQIVPGTAQVIGVDPNAPQTDPEGITKGPTFLKAQKRLEKGAALQPSDPLPPPDA